MSVLAILTLIGVVASIMNALKSNKSTSIKPFNNEFRTVIRNAGQQYKKLAQTISLSNSDESKALKVRGYEGQFPEDSSLYSSSQPNLTDLLEDFGDSNDIELPIIRKEPSLGNSSTSSKQPVQSLKGLDLKPSRKKLAEAFILAECFNEPRAKRPYHARQYKKKSQPF